MTIAALIVAAGRGTRASSKAPAGDGMGETGELPKQFQPIGGQPVLCRTLTIFAQNPAIDLIAIVIHPDYEPMVLEFITQFPDSNIILVHGSDTRQKSVFAGLQALQSHAPSQVLIHDAARPFLDQPLCRRVIDGLKNHQGALPALAVTDTLKRVEGGAIETIDRSHLYGAQTPQGFHYQPIYEAHEAAARSGRDDFTDDASIAEWHGLSITIVEGQRENIKITTAADLLAADLKLKVEDILQNAHPTQTPAQTPAQTATQQMEYRTGSGFDVHRFDDGNAVMLCGIEIPHSKSLKGHSDADVGLHALTDAILGAIGEGDIGTHFPPSDARWKGAASDQFLIHAANLVRQHHGKLVHIDVTLICEAPKIGPHRDAMIARMSEILELSPDRISIKATTTEGLGFAGRGEGIAAMASATIALPLI